MVVPLGTLIVTLLFRWTVPAARTVTPAGTSTTPPPAVLAAEIALSSAGASLDFPSAFAPKLLRLNTLAPTVGAAAGDEASASATPAVAAVRPATASAVSHTFLDAPALRKAVLITSSLPSRRGEGTPTLTHR